MARTAARKGTTKQEAKPAARGRGRKEPGERSTREAQIDDAAARRSAKEEANAILGAKVWELREEEELSWGEISERLGYGDGNATGKLQLRYFEEEVRQNPRLRITGKNETELGNKIRKARDEDQLSWGKIMARTGLGLSRVRTLYDESGGTALGHRIGKGGRHPGSAAPAAKASTKRGKAATAAKPTRARRARSK